MCINNLKRQGVWLYLDILRIHRKKLLQGKMRQFGDFYVKQEFTLHQKTQNIQYYEQFMQQWQTYMKDLENSKDMKHIAKNLDQSDKKFLNDEQKKTLDQLKLETQVQKNSP